MMRDPQPMRASSASACFLALLALMLPLPAALGKPQEPEHPETKQLVALVTKAAARVRSQGEAAFPAFRRKGSE